MIHKKQFTTYIAIFAMVLSSIPTGSWANSEASSSEVLAQIALKNKEALAESDRELRESLRNIRMEFMSILEEIRTQEKKDVDPFFGQVNLYTSLAVQVALVSALIFTMKVRKIDLKYTRPGTVESFYAYLAEVAPHNKAINDSVFFVFWGTVLTQSSSYVDLVGHRSIDAEAIAQSSSQLIQVLKDLHHQAENAEEQGRIDELIGAIEDIQFVTNKNEFELLYKKILTLSSTIPAVSSYILAYRAKGLPGSLTAGVAASVANLLSLAASFKVEDKAEVIQKLEDVIQQMGILEASAL